MNTLDHAAVRVAPAPPDFADWTALLALLQRAFAFMDGRIDPPSSLTSMDAAALQTKAQGEHLILAHHGAAGSARLVGCVFAAARPDCVYLGKLAVDEAWRGRGLARRLVNAAAQFAQAQQRGALELQTRIELRENHLAFEAMGFVKAGESMHPGYSRATSITMRKRLDANVAQGALSAPA